MKATTRHARCGATNNASRALFSDRTEELALSRSRMRREEDRKRPWIFQEYPELLTATLPTTAMREDAFEPETLFKSILSPVRIIGNVAVSDWDILGISMAASGLVLLYAFLTWTREGQFLGAVADNARLAELYGISARRAWRVVAVIAALFIVAAMYLIGTHGGVVPELAAGADPDRGHRHTSGWYRTSFAAAAAAVFLGLIQSFSILVIGSRWQNLLLYGVLFAAIVIFPRGVRLPRFRLLLAGR